MEDTNIVNTNSRRFKIELPEIYVSDESLVNANLKKFDDLTSDDELLLNRFPAKITEKTRKDGFGAKAVEVKYWLLEVLIASDVVVSRAISDLELSIIRTYNPDLILSANASDKRSKVKLFAKCMSFVNADGKRAYKVIIEVCPKVFWGTRVKQKNNNGFLSDQQVERIRIIKKAYQDGHTKEQVPVFADTTQNVADELDQRIDEFYNQD